MITDSNQVCFVKMTGRRVQEEVTITLDNVCIVKSSLTHLLFAALLPIFS